MHDTTHKTRTLKFKLDRSQIALVPDGVEITLPSKPVPEKFLRALHLGLQDDLGFSHRETHLLREEILESISVASYMKALRERMSFGPSQSTEDTVGEDEADDAYEALSDWEKSTRPADPAMV